MLTYDCEWLTNRKAGLKNSPCGVRSIVRTVRCLVSESTWRYGGCGVEGRSRVVIVCDGNAYIRSSERGESALDLERVFHRHEELERVWRNGILYRVWYGMVWYGMV